MYIMTNRTIIGNVAMQVAPPGGQTCNQCKWRHLVVQVAPPGSASSATWRPKLKLLQVTPPLRNLKLRTRRGGKPKADHC